ncbi:hypothetical protein DDZ18_07250 [Marinicauda salina]|uniref:Uncharacterized protein n=1 Tax=Marinicauda salina TaxID=2135793 RepID=A0A2U2BU00_9PROT|nr:hypothetical protein [Marinicauda salina]PWE17467.1 hypothetical protein DDZ18_07250 [Marinicauda salina]
MGLAYMRQRASEEEDGALDDKIQLESPRFGGEMTFTRGRVLQYVEECAEEYEEAKRDEESRKERSARRHDRLFNFGGAFLGAAVGAAGAIVAALIVSSG